MLGSAPSGHRDLVGLYLNLCSFPHDNLCRFSTNRSSKTTQMFYLMDTGSKVRSQYIENQSRCRCEDLPDVTHVRDAGRRGPGRVHQGPGQEVLHKPGGILEGARIKPDDTSGGFIPSQERDASCHRQVAEGNATAGVDVDVDWTWAWRLGCRDSADSLGTRLSSILPTDDRCSSSVMLVKIKIK